MAGCVRFEAAGSTTATGLLVERFTSPSDSENQMPDHPNKPGSDKADGNPRPPKDQQAMKNQGETTPDRYPEPARLDPEDR